MRGVVMTRGKTDICTASSTFLPAKSIAAARAKGKGMLALSADTKAVYQSAKGKESLTFAVKGPMIRWDAPEFTREKRYALYDGARGTMLLVDDGLQVCPREVGGFLRNLIKIDAVHRLACEYKPENGGAGRHIGRRYEDNAVESARTSERVVEVPRRVGGRQDEQAFVRCIDAVQLRQKLVDQVPPAAVPHIGPAGSQRVHLVEAQHAGPVASRLFEQLV